MSLYTRLNRTAVKTNTHGSKHRSHQVLNRQTVLHMQWDECAPPLLLTLLICMCHILSGLLPYNFLFCCPMCHGGWQAGPA